MAGEALGCCRGELEAPARTHTPSSDHADGSFSAGKKPTPDAVFYDICGCPCPISHETGQIALQNVAKPGQGETCAFRQNPARDRGCPSSTPPFRTDLNMRWKFQTTHENGHDTFPTKPSRRINTNSAHSSCQLRLDVFPYQIVQKIELARANLPRKCLRNLFLQISKHNMFNTNSFFF